MKVNKTISLDLEIMKELEEIPNASRLINKLLTEHFNWQNNPKSQKQMEVVYDRK